MYQTGFNQSNFVSPMTGLNNTNNLNPVVIQPLKKHPTIKKPYDYQWYEKTSQNGEFKYGLFECCSGPNGPVDGTLAVICCFVPWPGWILTASINGELAGLVGKLIIKFALC